MLASIAVAIVSVLPAAPGGAAIAPGRTFRASELPGGGEIAGHSFRGVTSADGRYVAFESIAGNLVPGDGNGRYDVFLRHIAAGTIERLSIARDGSEGNGDSFGSFMTPDARFIGWSSAASNLVPNDTNAATDVFLVDRISGDLERVSVTNLGFQSNGKSPQGARITPDGRYVTFWSSATNLVGADTNQRDDVFVRDRATGTTERASVASGGTQADGPSDMPAISPDGRFVAFRSYSTNLAGIDPSQGRFSDVYVHDRLTRQTERVSVSTDGEDGMVNAYRPAISADGRFVVFDAEGTNLVPSDTNGYGHDVYVRDRLTSRTEQVSVNSAGEQADDSSYAGSITPDGRYVAFVSQATNLGGDDAGICAISEVESPASCRDVYVHDRVTGQTDRVSVPTSGAEMNGNTWGPMITSDGRFVTYETDASALIEGDDNGAVDVMVTDRGPGVGIGELVATRVDAGVVVTGWARFRGDAVAAIDPISDGGPGARLSGTELVAARVATRPEENTLLARLELDRLPPAPRPPSAAQARIASAPGVVYGLSMTAGGIRYEARATRGVRTRAASAASFTLWRCAPACSQVATLDGSIGTTGDHVNLVIPFAAIGGEGAQLSTVRAFTGLGESATGALIAIDEVYLPPLAIPTRSLRVGIAPAGTDESAVSLSSIATTGGSFTGTLPPPEAGSYDVWARACVSDRCGSEVVRITVS